MGIDMFIDVMLYKHNQNCMSKKLLGLQNFKLNAKKSVINNYFGII